MDQGSLVEMQIKDGLWIIQELAQHGFDVTAAFWLKTEGEPWFLYIASRDVDEKGIAAAYRIIHETVKRKPDLWISPFDVKLISPNNPIAQDVLVNRDPRPMVPTRYHGRRLGNLNVEEGYLYGPLAQEAGAK